MVWKEHMFERSVHHGSNIKNSEVGNVIPIENQMDNLLRSRDKLSQKNNGKICKNINLMI